MSQSSRAALFIAVAVALLAAGLLLRPGSRSVSPPIGIPASRPTPSPARTHELRAALNPTARRFLTAFLRYEVGYRDGAASRSLRATATSGFAAELLRNPPEIPKHAPRSGATLGPLSIVTVSTDPPLASVTAVAHRSAGPEQLSFVFSRRRGRWLASAPGE